MRIDQSRSYIFIDGNNLQSTMRDIAAEFFEGRTIDVDWEKLKGDHRKAYYYDAVPLQLSEESDTDYRARVEPKLEYLKHIERQSGFHVRTGDAVSRRRQGLQQKMVDVQLAVDALSMASRGLFTSCTFVIGDLDFRPLIVALVEMGIDVELIFPPGRANDFLLAAADRVNALDVMQAFHWMRNDCPLTRWAPQSFSSMSNAIPDRPIVRRWEDEAYGSCLILKEDDHRFMLYSSKDPRGQQYRRLEMRAGNEAILRGAALARYDLIVPKG
ncbi:NYN domain-containing protein [Devosia sp. LjRoot3]|uniref:NYN domain-containing protein n=1 Tax=Devosia sp. LjRoot3 TaxID=3342319 RepID=UPI003ECEBB3E